MARLEKLGLVAKDDTYELESGGPPQRRRNVWYLGDASPHVHPRGKWSRNKRPSNTNTPAPRKEPEAPAPATERSHESRSIASLTSAVNSRFEGKLQVADELAVQCQEELAVQCQVSPQEGCHEDGDLGCQSVTPSSPLRGVGARARVREAQHTPPPPDACESSPGEGGRQAGRVRADGVGAQHATPDPLAELVPEHLRESRRRAEEAAAAAAAAAQTAPSSAPSRADKSGEFSLQVALELWDRANGAEPVEEPRDA